MKSGDLVIFNDGASDPYVSLITYVSKTKKTWHRKIILYSQDQFTEIPAKYLKSYDRFKYFECIQL